jgi:hypothetical protein
MLGFLPGDKASYRPEEGGGVDLDAVERRRLDTELLQ